uniref:Uncharacterized protein n=1 Tax=Romanomermis culicivorax TaxID=13658 RepID=A0A915KZ78_ROMCU
MDMYGFMKWQKCTIDFKIGFNSNLFNIFTSEAKVGFFVQQSQFKLEKRQIQWCPRKWRNLKIESNMIDCILSPKRQFKRFLFHWMQLVQLYKMLFGGLKICNASSPVCNMAIPNECLENLEKNTSSKTAAVEGLKLSWNHCHFATFLPQIA